MKRRSLFNRRVDGEEESSDAINLTPLIDMMFIMWEDGCRKVRLGLTTLDEVRNVAVNKTREMLELS